MPKPTFVSVKPKNWITPFPTIGQAIWAVANVLETKGDNDREARKKSKRDRSYEKLVKGDISDYETIKQLWVDAFNIRNELKSGKIQEAINYETNNLLEQYKTILKEEVSFEHSYRENIMIFLNRWIARIIHMIIQSILEGQDELLHKLLVSDKPIPIAFEWKYYENWEKFRKEPPLNRMDIIDKVPRWMKGTRPPINMKELFEVIELFYKKYPNVEINNVRRIFFCAKVIHNISQYPKILEELRRIDKCDIITLGEWYGTRGSVRKVLHDLNRDCKLKAENQKRIVEHSDLYNSLVNKLYHESHTYEDKKRLDDSLNDLEISTRNLHDIHICWWRTQELRAFWYVLSGEWESAQKCYEEIIDNIFYTGEQEQVLRVIFDEAITLAAFRRNRIFLKKLKHLGILFRLFEQPFTNSSNFIHTQVNKKSRSDDPVVEDWEVNNWTNKFYEMFPKSRFFISKEQLPKPDDFHDEKCPPLIMAVLEGNLQEVEKLLKIGTNVNKLYHGASALLFAILKMDMTYTPIQKEQGNIKFFELLSKSLHERKTLITLADKTHYNILGCAVASGNLAIVEKVLEMMKNAGADKADINIKYGEKNVTPLYRAVNLFIMGDETIQPKNWEYELMEAAEIVRILSPKLAGMTAEETRHNVKKAMSDPEYKRQFEADMKRKCDLHKRYHTKENLLPIIEKLLKAGSNPNEPHDFCNGDLKNYTPLMFAARFDLIEAFELLIKYNGDIMKTSKHRNESGGTEIMTCWHIAFKHKSTKVLKYMQDNDKNPKKILLFTEI
jgi:tetratricopeptide (TPR) repeat protein